MTGVVADKYSAVDGLANRNGSKGSPSPRIASLVCVEDMKCHVPDTVPVMSALKR